MLKIAILCLFCVFSSAHSLKAFAKQDGDFVSLKAFFYGNSPCIECEVELIKDGKIVKTLKTDEKGLAKFKPIASEFEIRINGGLGHEKRLNFFAKFDGTEQNKILQNANENSVNSEQNSSNLANFDEKNESEILKFALSFLIIFSFFGALYLVKKKR